MKTIQEKEQELDENQQLDAEELIQKMFSFIPIKEESPSSAIISAKFCAKVACDYLIDKLPNINDTPPIKRKGEEMYKQYWTGVKNKIESFKVT